jgi:hypothetical protein
MVMLSLSISFSMLRARGVQSTVSSSTVPSAFSTTICTMGPSAFITARIASSSITGPSPSGGGGSGTAVDDDKDDAPAAGETKEENWLPICGY